MATRSTTFSSSSPALGARPRITVFTAGQRGADLDDSARSVVAQSFEDWEWVVVLDHTHRRPSVDDPRFRILLDDAADRTTGAKALACGAALGDIFVELDAGDMLAATALQSIAEAFEANPDAGFAYSDHARVGPDDRAEDPTLSGLDGWRYRKQAVGGMDVMSLEAMEATPHNVSWVTYAPIHVRAFRRSAYEAAGGYRMTPDLLADHDMVGRLFRRTDFVHIRDCLYLQRVVDSSDLLAFGLAGPAQREVVLRYEQSIQPLALAWARRQGLLALDLSPAGGGAADGYIEVGAPGGDGIAGDVTRRLEAGDSSVGVVRARNFLHTVPEADRVGMWNELYRLLAPGGVLLSLTPAGARGPAPALDEETFWRLVDPARAEPGAAHRFQLSWLCTYLPAEPDGAASPGLVCANLLAVKDGPRQGGFLADRIVPRHS